LTTRSAPIITPADTTYSPAHLRFDSTFTYQFTNKIGLDAQNGGFLDYINLPNHELYLRSKTLPGDTINTYFLTLSPRGSYRYYSYPLPNFGRPQNKAALANLAADSKGNIYAMSISNALDDTVSSGGFKPSILQVTKFRREGDTTLVHECDWQFKGDTLYVPLSIHIHPSGELNVASLYETEISWGDPPPGPRFRRQLMIITIDPRNHPCATVAREHIRLPALSSELTLFPNPSSGAFTLQFEGGEARDVRILDAAGQTVARRAGVHSGAELRFPELPAGLYTVVLSGGGGRLSTRWLKR
jgi:hypothetical protein